MSSSGDSASTILVTPPPKVPMFPPESSEKVLNPTSVFKKQVLQAYEAELAILEDLVLKKRQMMAKKVVETARAVPHGHCTLSIC